MLRVSCVPTIQNEYEYAVKGVGTWWPKKMLDEKYRLYILQEVPILLEH